MNETQTEAEGRPRTCVIISYWNGVRPRRLYKLLRQMRLIDAGSPFDLVIVCNGGDKKPLKPPRRFDSLRPRILNRENTNYNLGAWEHGWRNAPGYAYYLFLQDDCHIKDTDWVHAFERRMDLDPGVGMLGELEYFSGMSWDYLAKLLKQFEPNENPGPARAIRRFISTMEAHGIPRGATGHFIPSIILFVRRDALERAGGFRYFGPSKSDAVASELAISRAVVAGGYAIARITNKNFHFLGHPQYEESGRHRRASASWLWEFLRSGWRFKNRLQTRLGIRRASRKRAPDRPFPPPGETPSAIETWD